LKLVYHIFELYLKRASSNGLVTLAMKIFQSALEN
jgi:hypothetical protein